MNYNFDFSLMETPNEELDKFIVHQYFKGQITTYKPFYSCLPKTECIFSLTIDENFLNNLFNESIRFKKLLKHFFNISHSECNSVFEKYFKNDPNYVKKLLIMSTHKASIRLRENEHLSGYSFSNRKSEELYNEPEFYRGFKVGDKLLIVKGIGVLFSGFTRHFISCMRSARFDYNFFGFVIFGGMAVFHISKFNDKYELVGRALVIPMKSAKGKNYLCWLRPYGSFYHRFYRNLCLDIAGPAIAQHLFKGNYSNCYISDPYVVPSKIISNNCIDTKLEALNKFQFESYDFSFRFVARLFYTGDNFLRFVSFNKNLNLFAVSYYKFLK